MEYSNNITFCIIIVLIYIIIISKFKEKRNEIVKCSKIDNRCYKIKKKYDSKTYNKAANILAFLNKTNIKVINHMKNKYFYNENNKYKKKLTANLINRYNPKSLREHAPKGLKNLSYVFGKGKSIGYCLREKRTGKNNLHKIDTILFVNLHELTHIASTENDPRHEKNFWKNFKIILHEAEEVGVYTPIDYSKNSVDYCGMMVTYNPYFNEKL